MENLGLVSIITPSYNSEKFIGETIEAIINQTYPYWELIITDDCSTDHTVDIINEYIEKDNRIRLIKSAVNRGAGASRNASIEAAKGRFIAFCDSDDVWTYNKLEVQIQFMLKKGCALSYASYMLMDEESSVNGVAVCMSKVTLNSSIRDNGIGCLTAMYDTEKIGKKYFPLIRKRQDWGLWLTILKETNIAYGIKQPLAFYRVRRASLSRNKFSLVKYNVNIYRQVLGYNILKSYMIFAFIYMPTYIFKKVRFYLNSL